MRIDNVIIEESFRSGYTALVISPNGEDLLNICLSPDPYPYPDHLRGGPSHEYNTYFENKSSQSKLQLFFSYSLDRQTYPHENASRCEGNYTNLTKESQGKHVAVVCACNAKG